MKSITVALIAALLIQIGYEVCTAQEFVAAKGVKIDQNRLEVEVMAPVVPDGHSRVIQNREVNQFLGGLLASGAASALMIFVGYRLPFDDENRQWESGEIVVMFGTPLAFLVTNSCTVYYIGKHYDRTAHGGYVVATNLIGSVRHQVSQYQ